MEGNLQPNGMTIRSNNLQVKREIKQCSRVVVAIITIAIRPIWRADPALASKARRKHMPKACNNHLIRLSTWLRVNTIAIKKRIAYSLPHLSSTGQIACNLPQGILKTKMLCNREASGVALRIRVWTHSYLMKLPLRSSGYYRANSLLQRKNNLTCICMSCLLLSLIKRALGNNSSNSISTWSQLAVDLNQPLK